ncbi:MAG: hypothetical protein ACOC4Z_02650 [Patescibacteria group bacterium]
MKGLRFLSKFSLDKFLTFLVVVLLLLYTFFPQLVHVDRYTAWFLALLFLLVILPSLESGKISYLFSFKRDLEKAREKVQEMMRKDGVENGEVKTKVQEKIKHSTDKTNPCLTTGKIRQQIKKRLYEMQERWLEEDEKKHDVSAEKVAGNLRARGYLSRSLYDAVKRILTICTPVRYVSELNPDDVQDILETSLPVLERLHELAKFYGEEEYS